MKLVVIFALFALAIGKKKENSGKSMQKEGKDEGQGKIKIMEAKGEPMSLKLKTPEEDNGYESKPEENIEEEPHGEGKVEEAPKKEKTYGKFSELKYGVSGVVTSKGNHQILDIKSFNYDGKAPDGYFVVGTAGSGPQDRIDAGDEASMKILCPTGKIFNFTNPTPAPKMKKAVNASYSLKLPENVKISDLKWIAVWCMEYSVLFGQLNFTQSEAGTETGLESETGSTTTLEPTTTTTTTTPTPEPAGFKKVGNVYHFSLPLGAVAEIKAVAAEENIEEEPHGENAVDKGEGKSPEIMTLEDHRTVDVKPDHRTVVVKPEEEEEEEESANASSIRLIPGKGKKGEGEGKMPKEDETGTDYVLP